MKYRGHRVFNWIITTTTQPGGAPFIDKCIVRDAEANHYRGRAFRLSLFKRDTPTLAFVIGKWQYNEIERLAQNMKQAFDSLAACLSEHEIEEIDRTVARHAADAGKLRDRIAAASHEVHPPMRVDERPADAHTGEMPSGFWTRNKPDND